MALVRLITVPARGRVEPRRARWHPGMTAAELLVWLRRGRGAEEEVPAVEQPASRLRWFPAMTPAETLPWLRRQYAAEEEVAAQPAPRPWQVVAGGLPLPVRWYIKV